MHRAFVLTAVLAAAAAVLPACGGGDEVAACEPGRAADAAPVATGDGAVGSLALDADGEVIVARVVSDSTPALFVDLDDNRDTGMWSLQSPVSTSGWDLFIDDKGTVHRHTGRPTEWSWASLPVAADDGTGWSATADGAVACIGPSVRTALGTGSEGVLRVSAVVGTESVPAMFLPGAPISLDDSMEAEDGGGLLPAPAPTQAGSLAVAYGYRPWRVAGCATPECAVARYAAFDQVVLGSGMEEPGHPSHAGAAELVAGIRAARPDGEVWGYVSLVGGPVQDGERTRAHSVDDIASRAAAWQAMGVTGIFLDEFDLCRPEAQQCTLGPDGNEIGVDRAHQTAAIAAVHRLGLPVFANGYAPADILGPVDGVPTTLSGAVPGRRADQYLLENITFADGNQAAGIDADASRARYQTARRLAAALGVRLAAVDTFHGAVPDGYRADPRYATARAATPDVVVHGITNEAYSATEDLGTNLALP